MVISTLEWKLADILSRISPKLHYLLARRKAKGPYKGPMIDHIFCSAYRLEKGDITQIELVNHLMALTKQAVKAGNSTPGLKTP